MKPNTEVTALAKPMEPIFPMRTWFKGQFTAMVLAWWRAQEYERLMMEQFFIPHEIGHRGSSYSAYRP